MTFKKGDPKPPTSGRKPAQPNKLSTKFKDAVLEVFHQMGDVRGMFAWAKKNPDKFYLMCCRLIPTEVHGKGFIPPPASKSQNISDAEFARRVAFVLAAGVNELENADLFKKNPVSTTTH